MNVSNFQLCMSYPYEELTFPWRISTSKLLNRLGNSDIYSLLVHNPKKILKIDTNNIMPPRVNRILEKSYDYNIS